MSLKFNPTTGTLDLVEPPVAGGITYNTDQILVDQNFLDTPTKALGGVVVADSEFIFLNGLFIDNSNYSIVGNILSWLVSADLRIGDTLDIKFNS